MPGSVRLVLPLHSDLAFAPYGEVYNTFGTANLRTEMFSGILPGEVVSGMFNTPNRELSTSQQGRWFSPDPIGAGWNAYAYGTDPLSQVDPSGLIMINPSWYLGFMGAGGLFFGGTEVAWPTSPAAPASGTVEADQGSACACPPTAPGSATGLGIYLEGWEGEQPSGASALPDPTTTSEETVCFTEACGLYNLNLSVSQNASNAILVDSGALLGGALAYQLAAGILTVAPVAATGLVADVIGEGQSWEDYVTNSPNPFGHIYDVAASEAADVEAAATNALNEASSAYQSTWQAFKSFAVNDPDFRNAIILNVAINLAYHESLGANGQTVQPSPQLPSSNCCGVGWEGIQ